jgi:precorrin-6B methylase 1
MAKAKPQEKPAPSSYQLLAMRIQRTINATAAQTAKRTIIYKASDELDEDWAQLLMDIDEAENVTLTPRDDGGVLVAWVVPKED